MVGMSVPLPPQGSTAWYAHYSDMDAQLRQIHENGDIPTAPTPPAGARDLGSTLWTQKIGTSLHPLWPSAPATASTSTTFVRNLNFQGHVLSTTSTPLASSYNPPYTTKTNTNEFGLPIAMVGPDRALQKVYVADLGKTTFQSQLNLLGGVRIPDPAAIPGGVVQADGTDGTLILIYVDANGTPTGQVFEFWKFGPRLSTDPAEYQWRCVQGGYIENKDTHPGIWSSGTSSPPGYNWGVSASGMARLGVMLKAEDYYAADINHPLGLGMPITGGPGIYSTGTWSVLPATRADKKQAVKNNTDPALQTTIDDYRVREGAWFRLPPATWTNAAITTYANANGDDTAQTSISIGARKPSKAVLAKIMRCARDYGMVLQDSAGVVTVTGENDKMFGTPYHPYGTNEVPVWNNILSVFPLDQLIQLQPPTVDISIPTGA